MKKETFINSLLFFLILTVITGILYPLLVTGIARLFFQNKAEGSLVYKNGKAIGSSLIGQKFTQQKYFWGRPSAGNYDPLNSSATNKGWISKDSKENVENNRKKFASEHFISENQVPEDLLFSSASGLDPHISPLSANLQIERISQARNFNQFQKQALINLVRQSIESPDLGFMGEPRINVLLLNIQLDQIR